LKASLKVIRLNYVYGIYFDVFVLNCHVTSTSDGVLLSFMRIL